MNIHERLQEIRKNRDLSVYRLSIDSGVSESHIRSLEAGKRQPTFYTLKKLADSLNISLSEFFNEDNTNILYPTTDELELILFYRSLSTEKATGLLDFCKIMSK